MNLKRPILLWILFQIATLAVAIDGVPKNENLHDIEFGFSPVGTQAICTLTCDIPNTNERQPANDAPSNFESLEGTEDAEKARSQKTGSYNNGLNVVNPKTICAFISQHTKSSPSRDDCMASAKDKADSSEQSINQQQNGGDWEKNKKSIPSHPSRLNFTVCQALDVQSLSNISNWQQERIKFCESNIPSPGDKLKNSFKSVKVEIQINQGLSQDRQILTYTREQLKDSFTLSDQAHSTPDTYLTQSPQTTDVAHSSAVISNKIVTFSVQKMRENGSQLEHTTE